MELSHAAGLGYGVVVVAVVEVDVVAGAEVEGVVEASVVGADALASTITVRVLVDVSPQVSVAT